MKDTDRTQTQYPESDPQKAPPPSEWSIPEITTPGLQTTPQEPSHTQTLPSHANSGAQNSPVPGYQIQQELGRGGMGIVFKALQVKLNRVVALKMVRAGDDADARELIRFLAEAESAAAVKHPNVVHVYDYGDANGQPFMAIEYCPGGTLQDWIKQQDKTINVMKAVAMVQQIALGVGAAHDAGIVHRDLKPANVLFDDEGVPKVADFGLAKRTSVDLTKTDAVMGTPAYMSPEQATGRTKFVGPQADVWALGVILFECVTGRRPFEGDNSFSLLQKVAHEEAPGLRSITHAVNQDLDLICRKCLSKNPLERYATAGELAEELGRFLRGEPVSVRKPYTSEQISRWIRKKPAVAAAYFFSSVTVVLLGVGLGFAHLWHKAELARDETALALTRVEDAMSQAQQSRSREQQATEALARREYARTIEYARSLASTGHTPSAAQLLTSCKPEYRGWEWDYVNKLSRPETFSLTVSEGPVYCTAYRNDGKQLATVSKDGGIRFWNPKDGTSQGEIATNTGPIYVIAYDPVRNRFATGGKEGRLRIWDAAERKVLFQSSEAKAELATLVYSPNGQFLVSGYANGTFHVWNPNDGKEIATVLAHKEAIGSLAISPDGTLLATGSYDKTIRLWNTMTWKSQANPLKGHLAAVTAVAFSPDRSDGLKLISGSDDGNLILWDAKNGRKTQTFYLSANDTVATGPDLMPRDPSPIHQVRLEQQPPRTAPTPRADSRAPMSPQVGNDFTPSTGIPISDLAYSPNGKYLLVGRQDGTAMIVRFGLYETRVTRTELLGEFRRGNWLRMIEARPLILTMADRQAASQWTLHGHVARINSVAFSPDGQQIATSCDNGISKLWSAAPQESEDLLDTRYAGQLEFISENHLAVISAYGERRVISTAHTPPSHYRNLKYQFIPPPPPPIKPLKKNIGPANAEAIDRSMLLTRFLPPVLPNPLPTQLPQSAPKPFAPMPPLPRPEESGDVPPPLPIPPTTAPITESARLQSGIDHPFAVGVSRNGQLVAVAERGELFLHRHDLGIRQVAFTATMPNPMWGILGMTTTPIRVGPLAWPKSTPDKESPHAKNMRSSYSIGSDESITDITAIALDSRGKRVAAARRDGWVAIWSLVDYRCLRAYQAHEERVHVVTFSPDDTMLATGSEDNTAVIWNVESGERNFTLSNKQIDVTAIAFSPDGTLVITGGEDGTLRTWDPGTGSLRSTLSGHTAHINVICFSGDGKRFATAAIDRTLRLWNTEQMLEVLTLEPGIIHALKFSPSGDSLAAAMSSGGVKWISRRYHKHPLFPAFSLLE